MRQKSEQGLRNSRSVANGAAALCVAAAMIGSLAGAADAQVCRSNAGRQAGVAVERDVSVARVSRIRARTANIRARAATTRAKAAGVHARAIGARPRASGAPKRTLSGPTRAAIPGSTASRSKPTRAPLHGSSSPGSTRQVGASLAVGGGIGPVESSDRFAADSVSGKSKLCSGCRHSKSKLKNVRPERHTEGRCRPRRNFDRFIRGDDARAEYCASPRDRGGDSN